MRNDPPKLLLGLYRDLNVSRAVRTLGHGERRREQFGPAIVTECDLVRPGLDISQTRRRLAGAGIQLKEIADDLHLFGKRIVNCASEPAVPFGTDDASRRLTPAEGIEQNVLGLGRRPQRVIAEDTFECRFSHIPARLLRGDASGRYSRPRHRARRDAPETPA